MESHYHLVSYTEAIQDRHLDNVPDKDSEKSDHICQYYF